MLFSGDGDFRRLVEAIQRKGVGVTVISTLKTNPPMVADDLRRQTDMFVDIMNLSEQIGRAGGQRKQRPQDNESDNGPEDDNEADYDQNDDGQDDFDEFADI